MAKFGRALSPTGKALSPNSMCMEAHCALVADGIYIQTKYNLTEA